MPTAESLLGLLLVALAASGAIAAPVDSKRDAAPNWKNVFPADNGDIAGLLLGGGGPGELSGPGNAGNVIHKGRSEIKEDWGYGKRTRVSEDWDYGKRDEANEDCDYGKN